MQVTDHDSDKKLCKSIEDLLFMQFMRQVFYKAGIKKKNTYLYFAVFIYSTFANLSKDDSYVFKYRSAA